MPASKKATPVINPSQDAASMVVCQSVPAHASTLLRGSFARALSQSNGAVLTRGRHGVQKKSPAKNVAPKPVIKKSPAKVRRYAAAALHACRQRCLPCSVWSRGERACGGAFRGIFPWQHRDSCLDRIRQLQNAPSTTKHTRTHAHTHTLTHSLTLTLTLAPEPGQGGGKEPGKESGARQEGNSCQEAQARGHHGQETQGANLCGRPGQSTAYPSPRC
ncbi:MAG: hypothetical protein ACPIOQ_08640 [Promethearchaeia archaeon]